MKKFIAIIFTSGFAFLCNTAHAADTNDMNTELQYKTELRDTLKSDIAQIDSEKARCEKTKRSWTIATVVGGVGVVGTGVGVIVQNNKLQKQKEDLETQQKEIDTIKQTDGTDVLNPDDEINE